MVYWLKECEVELIVWAIIERSAVWDYNWILDPELEVAITAPYPHSSYYLAA